MKRSIKASLIVGLMAALSPLAATGQVIAKASGQPPQSVFIEKDGRTTIQGDADQEAVRISAEALRYKSLSCDVLGKASSGVGTVTIRADPQTRYVPLMQALSWVWDCGVRDLHITGQVVDERTSAGRAVTIDLRSEPPPPPQITWIKPPKGIRPGTRSEPIPVIHLHQDGYLNLAVGENVKRTSLRDLSEEIQKATGSKNPSAERIAITCDRNVIYDRLIQLMDQLNRDGYARFWLVNQDIQYGDVAGL